MTNTHTCITIPILVIELSIKINLFDEKLI